MRNKTPVFTSRVINYILLLCFFVIFGLFSRDVIAFYIMRMHDIKLLPIGILLIGACVFLPTRGRGEVLWVSDRSVWALGLIIVLLCVAGHHFLLSSYDFTRDEQMANFDAAIFRHAQLAWPLPHHWQTNAEALNLRFMLSGDRPIAWVSAYLPMHALIRALFGEFTSPLLTALAFVMLWACARKIWPEQRENAVICALLFASSAQILFTGMTSYAMPAHLFFNLLWLWLFLHDRRNTDAFALLIGFIATGLHQPLFHPMFVAPFLLLLVLERRWSRLGLYCVGYTLIGLFWLYWPIHMQSLVSVGTVANSQEDMDYVARLLGALAQNKDNVSTMAAHMLRFCTWQNIFLIPLMLASWPIVRRNRLAGAIGLSFILPVLVMGIILPSQGHGFGYRYFHAVLGNAILLAGYGWSALTNEQAALRIIFCRALGCTSLVLLPLQAWMASALYTPFAKASARIDASDADYALLVDGRMPMLHDLVLNQPDLSNRPIRLLQPRLDEMPRLARLLCSEGVKVAVPSSDFYAPLAGALHMPRYEEDVEESEQRDQLLRDAGCSITTIGKAVVTPRLTGL